MDFKCEINYDKPIKIKPALHVAIEAKSKEDVSQLLLQHGANSAIYPEEGCTPLHVAACVPNNIEILDLLLDHGAHLESRNCYRRTPLHDACNKENNAENVKFLLEHGANIHSLDTTRNTALHFAVEETNNFETVKFLVKYNCDVNARNDWSYTPLHQASQKGNVRVVEFLIRNGAHVNAQSFHFHTPLFYAVHFGGNFEIVESLLNHGADVYHRYFGAHATIFYAAISKKRNFEVINLLLQHGAEATCLTEIVNKIDARSNFHLELMNHLIKEIIILKSLNLISETQFISWTFLQDYISEDILEFKEACEVEVYKLRNKFICSDRNITLADILTNNLRKVANYVSVVDVKKRLDKVNYNYQFPIYVEILKKRISEAKKLSIVLKKGYQALEFSLNDDKGLPDSCIHLILKCLSKTDIEHLYEAFQI